MFKQLSILALTVSCSYAMESIPTTPIGDIDIKQTTEEVKNNNTINDVTKTDTQDVTLTKVVNADNKSVEDIKQNQNNSKDTVKDITNELSVLDIDKTVQVLNNINKKNDQNAEETILNNKNSNTIDIDNNNSIKIDTDKNTTFIKDIKVNCNKDTTTSNKYNTNVINKIDSINTESVFDIKALLADIKILKKNKKLAQLDDNKKDWFKLYTYDKFSRMCQNFWQEVMRSSVITESMINNLCTSKDFFNCVILGITPLTVLKDEIKFNVDPKCVIKSHLFQLKDRALYLSHMVTRHTKRIRYHRNKTQALQERLQTDDIKMVNKSYWDNYWRNYETLSKEY